MDGSLPMTESAISFPFSIDSRGSIAYTTDINKIWEDRVRLVLFTSEHERVMRPTFGTQIRDLVFESNYSTTTAAERVVAGAFARWLPALKLKNVIALPDDVNGGLIVQVNYTLPNGTPGSLMAPTTTANLNRYGDVVTQ